jgi:hypothetical protein
VPFNSIVPKHLAAVVTTAAVLLSLSGVVRAEEPAVPASIPAAVPSAIPAVAQPGAEIKTEPPQKLPEAVETYKTATGAYYRLDANSYAYYEKPKIYSFLVNAPLDIVDWLKDSFQGKNALTIAGIAAATGGLIMVDQDLIRMSKDVGHSLNISGDSAMGRVSKGSPIQYPKDLGTALYYLGDGMIPISITVGMFSYGMISSDIRSLQTSSQLAEGLVSVAIVVQTLKRTTGRESPEEATRSGGTWRFFPSFKQYGSNTPKYDAFPSGHLATGMMTITVLADNYPEYTLIRPVGYTLMGLLGFQMLNNGVHWASDYPLAIAIGYGLGKVAVSHGRKVVSADNIPDKSSKNKLFTDVSVVPYPIANGGAVALVAKF